MRQLNLTRQPPPDPTWLADHARPPAILRRLAATHPLNLPAADEARLLRYLVAVARQYRQPGVSWEDLLAACYAGATNCLQGSPDPVRWLAWWVRQGVVGTTQNLSTFTLTDQHHSYTSTMLESSNSVRTTIEGFKSLTKDLEIQRWQGSCHRLNNLLVGWRAMQPMMQLLERTSAPDYNIFYVMKNMRASEVKLHSPFLADLFNVRGEHKQGALFFTELLRLLELPVEQHLSSDLYHFSAQTEVDSGTGGIDILLSYRNGPNNFAIAIENKIYAGDGKKQLERYHTYLKREFGNRFVLAYLTPEGRKPSDYSASAEFLARYDIPCLSYRRDIIGLLQKTIPHIQAAHVRATVEQYLTVCQDI